MSRRVWAWLLLVGRSVHSVRTNAPLMLLSLGLATVLWAFVTNSENPPERQVLANALPISSTDAVNVPKGLVVTSLKQNKVTVTLIGSKQTISKVTLADVIVDVDLSGVDTSTSLGTGGDVPAKIHATVKRSGVRVEVDPATITVSLEPEVRRTVPIKVSLIDAPPVGYELSVPPAPDPDSALIAGLKQNVDAVDAVYADLKLGGLSVSSSLTLPLSPRSSDGRAVSNISVQPLTVGVKITISRTIFNREAFVAVQTNGRAALGYQVQDRTSDPATVTIAGSLDTLNNVTAIPTDAVEVEGATQDVKRVVGLRPPPGVTIVAPRTVTATVSIAASRGSGSTLVAPRVVGAAPGLSVQLSVASVTVSFVGPLPQVLAVKPGDILVTLDVTGLSAGAYSLEPKVSLPQGIERDSVLPVRVDVTLVGPPPVATPARP